MMIQDKTLKRLSANFIALASLKLLNYILPLLLIPYLIRVIGMEGFGVYSFVLAIVMYGSKLSDYGFELSGTYHISKYRENQEQINTIFSSIMTIKVLIALFYIFIVILSLFLLESISAYSHLLLLALGTILGQALFPLWFFQGIEQMRYISIINGVAKLLFFLAVFIFVRHADDIDILLLLTTVSALLAGAWGLYVALKQFNIQLTFQPWSRLQFYLKDGWYIFTAKLAVEFYTTINIIILGFYASATIVGYYALSLKIIYAIGGLLEPITQTVYPYLVNTYQESKKQFMQRNIQLTTVIFMIMFPISLIVYLYAKEILEIISNQEVVALNIEILQIFAWALMVYLYGSQFTNILVTINESKFLNNILLITAGINLFFAPILLYFFGVIGLAWLGTFVAFFIAFSKGYYIYLRR